MTLNLSEQESETLLGLLEARHSGLLHELHHTDTADYKQILKDQITLIEGLLAKVKGAA